MKSRAGRKERRTDARFSGQGKTGRISALFVVLLLVLLLISACGKRTDSEEVLIAPDGESHPVEVADVPLQYAPEGEDNGTEDPEDDEEENGSKDSEDGKEDKGSKGKSKRNRSGKNDPMTVSPENPGGMLYLILPSNEGPSLTEKSIITAASGASGIVVLNYAGDPFAEANAFEKAIREKASLIVCDNIDETQTIRGVKRAKEAGIPVILMGRGIDIVGMASSQILTESYSRIRVMGEDYAVFTDKRAVYAILVGEGTARDLADAFDSVMKRYSDMTLAASVSCDEQDEDSAYNTVWDLIREHPEIDTIVAYNTVQARAAMNAAADLGSDVRILCLAGDSDFIRTCVENGKIHAAIVKPAEELARVVAEQIEVFYETGELPGTECIYVQGELLTTAAPEE